MPEKLLKIITTIKKNIDRTAIVIFGVLMVSIIFIYFSEVNSSGPIPPEAGNKAMEKYLPSPAFEAVTKAEGPVVKFENNKNYFPLGQFNMFDSKSVKTKEQIEQDVLTNFDAAQKMYDKAELETNNAKKIEYYQNTITLCKKILIMKREHSGASKLLSETEAKITKLKEKDKKK